MKSFRGKTRAFINNKTIQAITMLPAAQKYLERYAEPFVAQQAATLSEAFDKGLSLTPSKRRTARYDCVLIIPAYNESTAFVRRLMHQAFDGQPSILVIIVINQPAGRHSQTTRLNQRLWDFFDDTPYTQRAATRAFKLIEYAESGCDYLCIKQCEPGINPKHGVGYARKLGCDLAIHLMLRGLIGTSWLYCTDADATLPRAYFDAAPLNASYSAINYAFNHKLKKSDQASHYQHAVAQANALYEKSLFYYRDGLKAAGSPYALTTLGSAMAIHPNYYCMARGFPKRAGGEDFYLLNKLIKLAPVFTSEQVISLKPRASNRVPFGTGPAVANILHKKGLVDFDRRVFMHLKEWLDFLPALHNQCITDNIEINATKAIAALSPETQKALATIKVNALLEH
ncbi:MAG TPA: hypothetical protein VIC26_11695, partial [Marinagarivorans sp.]